MVYQWYNGVDNDNNIITRNSSFGTHMAICIQITKAFLLIDPLITKFIPKTFSFKNNMSIEMLIILNIYNTENKKHIK